MPTDVRAVAAPRLGDFIGEVTFVPADPPRESSFALWRPVPGFASHSDLELAIRDGEGVRIERLTAAVAGGPPAVGTRSLLGWQAAVRAGLALVARGRLRPSISREGHDAWRAGPLAEEDEDLLERLAAALPAEAHAVPIEGDPSRILAPAGAIRACWDAVADSLPRTAGAEPAFGGPLYSAWRPHPAGHLASRLLDGAGAAGQTLRLRLELPSHGAPRLASDPPPYDGMVALHLGARRFPPLSRLLQTRTVELTETEADHLMGLGPELGDLGIEVVLPRLETADVRAWWAPRLSVTVPSSRSTPCSSFGGRWRRAIAV